MRTFFMLLAILMASIQSMGAEPLTQGERDRALSELYASRKRFLDAIAGLSDAQWKFKADPAKWSIAECAEHITVSEDFIFGVVTKLMKSPADPSKREQTKGKDEVVLRGVMDRSRKFQAPEPIVPTNRWPDRQVLIDHFVQSRDHTLDYVRSTPDDLRDHFGPHPAMGMLDAYQWILLLSAHTQRHTAQIDEVKANAAYPR